MKITEKRRQAAKTLQVFFRRGQKEKLRKLIWLATRLQAIEKGNICRNSLKNMARLEKIKNVQMAQNILDGLDSQSRSIREKTYRSLVVHMSKSIFLKDEVIELITKDRLCRFQLDLQDDVFSLRSSVASFLIKLAKNHQAGQRLVCNLNGIFVSNYRIFAMPRKFTTMHEKWSEKCSARSSREDKLDFLRSLIKSKIDQFSHKSCATEFVFPLLEGSKSNHQQEGNVTQGLDPFEQILGVRIDSVTSDMISTSTLSSFARKNKYSLQEKSKTVKFPSKTEEQICSNLAKIFLLSNSLHFNLAKGKQFDIAFDKEATVPSYAFFLAVENYESLDNEIFLDYELAKILTDRKKVLKTCESNCENGAKLSTEGDRYIQTGYLARIRSKIAWNSLVIYCLSAAAAKVLQEKWPLVFKAIKDNFEKLSSNSFNMKTKCVLRKDFASKMNKELRMIRQSQRNSKTHKQTIEMTLSDVSIQSIVYDLMGCLAHESNKRVRRICRLKEQKYRIFTLRNSMRLINVENGSSYQDELFGNGTFSTDWLAWEETLIICWRHLIYHESRGKSFKCRPAMQRKASAAKQKQNYHARKLESLIKQQPSKMVTSTKISELQQLLRQFQDVLTQLKQGGHTKSEEKKEFRLLYDQLLDELKKNVQFKEKWRAHLVPIDIALSGTNITKNDYGIATRNVDKKEKTKNSKIKKKQSKNHIVNAVSKERKSHIQEHRKKKLHKQNEASKARYTRNLIKLAERELKQEARKIVREKKILTEAIERDKEKDKEIKLSSRKHRNVFLTANSKKSSSTGVVGTDQKKCENQSSQISFPNGVKIRRPKSSQGARQRSIQFGRIVKARNDLLLQIERDDHAVSDNKLNSASKPYHMLNKSDQNISPAVKQWISGKTSPSKQKQKKVESSTPVTIQAPLQYKNTKRDMSLSEVYETCTILFNENDLSKLSHSAATAIAEYIRERSITKRDSNISRTTVQTILNMQSMRVKKPDMHTIMRMTSVESRRNATGIWKSIDHLKLGAN